MATQSSPAAASCDRAARLTPPPMAPGGSTAPPTPRLGPVDPGRTVAGIVPRQRTEGPSDDRRRSRRRSSPGPSDARSGASDRRDPRSPATADGRPRHPAGARAAPSSTARSTSTASASPASCTTPRRCRGPRARARRSSGSGCTSRSVAEMAAHRRDVTACTSSPSRTPSRPGSGPSSSSSATCSFLVLRTARYVEHGELTENTEVVETGQVMLFIGAALRDHRPARRRLSRWPRCAPSWRPSRTCWRRARGRWPTRSSTGSSTATWRSPTGSRTTSTPSRRSVFVRARCSGRIQRIYQLKRELVEFKRAVVPLQRPLADAHRAGQLGTCRRRSAATSATCSDHLTRTVEQVIVLRRPAQLDPAGPAGPGHRRPEQRHAQDRGLGRHRRRVDRDRRRLRHELRLHAGAALAVRLSGGAAGDVRVGARALPPVPPLRLALTRPTRPALRLARASAASGRCPSRERPSAGRRAAHGRGRRCASALVAECRESASWTGRSSGTVTRGARWRPSAASTTCPPYVRRRGRGLGLVLVPLAAARRRRSARAPATPATAPGGEHAGRSAPGDGSRFFCLRRHWHGSLRLHLRQRRLRSAVEAAAASGATVARVDAQPRGSAAAHLRGGRSHLVDERRRTRGRTGSPAPSPHARPRAR